MVELDIILVSTDWEAKYPLCTAYSLTRVGSDHSPIILNSGADGTLTVGRFYFEKN